MSLLDRAIEHQKTFHSCPEIRWSALIGDNGNVLFSLMREGVESLVPENGITGFMEANGSRSILNAAKELADWAGEVEGALIRHDQVFLHVIRLQATCLF
jgi:hypothetical protein